MPTSCRTFSLRYSVNSRHRSEQCLGREELLGCSQSSPVSSHSVVKLAAGWGLKGAFFSSPSPMRRGTSAKVPVPDHPRTAYCASSRRDMRAPRELGIPSLSRPGGTGENRLVASDPIMAGAVAGSWPLRCVLPRPATSGQPRPSSCCRCYIVPLSLLRIDHCPLGPHQQSR